MELMRPHLLYTVREKNAKPLRYGLQVSLAPLLNPILKKDNNDEADADMKGSDNSVPRGTQVVVVDDRQREGRLDGTMKLTLNM